MHPAEIARRRRALHAGLRQLLPEAAARDAVELWTRDYASAPDLSLHRFVRALSERFALPRSHHEVHTLLWKSLIDTARAEGYEPAPVAPPSDAPPSEARTAATAAAPASLPGHRVALEVMTDFVQSVERAQTGGVRFTVQAVRSLLADRKSVVCSRALAEAIGAGDRHAILPAACSVVHLARALSVLYAAACHEVGPVTADRLLSAAVKRAAALPEAAAFPPSKLL